MAAAIGSRAACTAGRSPPRTPIASAKPRLEATIAGEIRKAKATSLKLCGLEVPVV